MVTISVTSDVARAKQTLTDVQKLHVPYAERMTVNALAETVKKRVEKDIRERLDRPTRYTQSMMRVQYASKTSLTSKVLVKSTALTTKRGGVGPDEILNHLFGGGPRRGKGFEGLLKRVGVMPAGMWAVPGEGARLDAYGNIERSQLIQLIAYFGAFQESGFRANMTDKSRGAFERRDVKKIKGATSNKYFVVNDQKPGGLIDGIWQRIGFGSGVSIRPVIVFVDKEPIYKQYFDMDRTAADVISEDFSYEFEKAIAYALATAREDKK